VDIHWQLFVDAQQLDSGRAHVDAAPHTTAPLRINLTKLGTLKEGQTCYARLTFSRDGEEIAQRHVELLAAVIEKVEVQKQTLNIEETADAIFVMAGSTTFEFSRKTGLPVSVTLGGQKAFGAMRPTIWHALNEGDQIIKNRSFESGKDPERAVPTVQSMSARETAAGIEVCSEVDYTIDSLNSFSAIYQCIIDQQARLTVSYTIRPQVQMTYLPVVGMAVGMTTPTDLTQWFGLGPHDAYPNKKAACTLGVWPASGLTGTRQARWVELDTAKGIKTRILADGYIDRDKASSKELRILSQVLGRAEKGRLNDINYRVLPTQVYCGKLIITQ
jgi:beta-galactosidase